MLKKLSEHVGDNAERQANVFDLTLSAAQAYAPRLPQETRYLLESANALTQDNPEREAKLLHTSLEILVPYLLEAAPAEQTRDVIGIISKLSGVPLGEVSLKASTVFIPAKREPGYPNQFLFTGDSFMDDTFVRQNGFVKSIRYDLDRIQYAESALVLRGRMAMDTRSREIITRNHEEEQERVPNLRALVDTANSLFCESRACPNVHAAMLQLMENRGSQPHMAHLLRQQMASPALST